MISIKPFLERGNATGPDQSLVEALRQMGRRLLDGMARHVVRGNETDFMSFRRTMNRLAIQMEEPQSASTTLSISSDAVEALETYNRGATEYFREQRGETLSMVAMLIGTVADLSGQTDASVARLQAIEKQIERASELDDIRALRANLKQSLLALRVAAARQRSSSVETLERLRSQIATAQTQISGNPNQSRDKQEDLDLIPELSEGPVEYPSSSYVAAIRLQRGAQIALRFGEAVTNQMLATIGTQLKTVLGPADRLVRWKGTSFVMFINSTAPLTEIRGRLLRAVGKTSQQYIEAGSKSALLSVGVDWVVFPQADRPSLDAIFAEVDALSANARRTSPPGMTPR